MAPLPDNLTDRYFIDYEGLSGKHTIMFRFGTEVVFADAVTRITGIINLMKGLVHTSTIFADLRVSQSGTNVSFPATWTAIAGTVGTAPTAPMYPQFVSFVGRDLNGVRVRYTIHGVTTAPDSDYRILGTENAPIQSIIDALGNGTPSLVTAGGTTPVMNNYANFGYNAYFQRKRRRVA